MTDATRIELKHLRYVVAIADCGSLSAAAARLRVEVSAVSRALRYLEGELDVVLFDRSSRGSRITPAGAEYVRSAKEILEQIERANQAAILAAQGLVGKLRIGVVWTFASGPVMKLLTSYEAENEYVDLSLVEHTDEELISRLLKNDLDVALTASFSKPVDRDPVLRGLNRASLWLERLHVAMPAPCAHETVSWEALIGHPLICKPAGEWRKFVAYVERHKGPKLSFIEQEVSSEGVLGLVAAGLGWAVLPGSLAPVVMDAVRVVPIEAPGAQVQVEALWSRRTVNPALTRFLNLARRLYAPGLSDVPL